MKFSIPKRYDAELADAGVWFNIVDENGNEYGEFKCRYLDEASPRTEVAYKRIRQKYAAQIRAKKLTDIEAVKVVFVEAVLMDWKGIKDEKGKEVPYEVATALDYFSLEETRWVLLQLGKLSGDVTNFAPEIVDVEAVEKN